MNSVRTLHDKAMLLLQDAIVFNHKGKISKAEQKYKEAFKLETQAADLVSQKANNEPTRSILYRSAASLAFQAGELDSSLRLIGECLCGNPSAKIKDEIRVLYEKINFRLYSQQKRKILTDEELDCHFVGNLISDGLIFYKDFIDRIQCIINIIKKTSQRMLERPYGSTAEIFTPVLHPIANGSFSMTIRIAYNKNQQQDMFISPEIVVDEVLDCFDYIQNGKENDLFLKIKDKKYCNNFIGNAKKIAPDGENITGVDFISKRREINFSRISDDIPLVTPTRTKNTEELQIDELSTGRIIGILDFASSKQGKNEYAEVTGENGVTYTIIINEGLDEYVKSYYKSQVMVEGEFDEQKKIIYMTNMKPL